MKRWTVFGVRADGSVLREVVEARRAEHAPLEVFDAGRPWKVVAVFEDDLDDELRLLEATHPEALPLAPRAVRLAEDDAA